MANTDFFKEFRKTYKPKKIPDITPYLRFDKLKNYRILNDITKLFPGKIYIKLINKCDAFENNKYSSKVIKDGGMLLSGGYYKGSEYVRTNDRNEWTHLELDTNISKKTGRRQKYYTYNIKISKYYIFYEIVSTINIFDILTANNKNDDWSVELLNG